MTIHLDNGTTIEMTKDMLSITNGFRGFTLDLNTNELHRATDTVILEGNLGAYMQEILLKGICNLAPQLECLNTYINVTDDGYDDTHPAIKGLLRKEDLEIDWKQAFKIRNDNSSRYREEKPMTTLTSMLNQVSSRIGEQTLPVENLASFLKETCPTLEMYLIHEVEDIVKRLSPRESLITSERILDLLTMAWNNSYND